MADNARIRGLIECTIEGAESFVHFSVAMAAFSEDLRRILLHFTNIVCPDD